MNTAEHEDSGLANWQQDIKALEAEHCRAFVAGDFERLERLWSDELIVNSPINCVHDKKRILGLLRGGVISHTGLECQAEAMMQHGHFVVVMGHELVSNAGAPALRRRYTNVWRLAQGSWQLVARHANVINDSSVTQDPRP